MNFQSDQWPISGTPTRINQIKLNQIADIADLARDNPNVIKLWIGESDLPTPDFIKQASVSALHAGHTRYTYSLGIPALREALSRYHKRHWNVNIDIDRFSITAGGVQAVMQALQAILNPGDEVIIPVPAWPNQIEIAGIVGGVVVPVSYRTKASGGFTLELDDLFAAVTAKTKAIILNSPSNPTGWVMPKEQMLAVRDFARERGLWIISDEVYTHFTYDGSLIPSFLQICEPTDRLIVTNTFSKNWCMTGWRMGWLVFPKGMSLVFDNLSQYNTTSVATFLQYGAIAALDEGDGFIKTLVERSAKGREIICSALDRLPNVRVFWPEGAFYFFFSVTGMESGYRMARQILQETSVGVAPGSAFGPGGEAFLRVCFAVDPALITEATQRLEGFLRSYQPHQKAAPSAR